MQAMELFSVMAALTLDKSDFDENVKRADQSGKTLAENLSGYMEKAKKILKDVAKVMTVKKIASSVWNLAKETSEAGDRIDKTSQSLGLSRRAFQEWDYILRQNGASIDSMGAAMKTMQEAISGNSDEAAASFAKLGLSAARLQSMSPEQQFETLVKALQDMPDGADKTAIAMQLFGRNAQSLMPLLNSSADSVEELRNRAHELGLIMSDEDVDASVAFGDALDDLSAVWTAFKNRIGAQLLPGFTTKIVNVANSLGRLSTALGNAFKTKNFNEFFSVLTQEISNFIPGVVDTIVEVASGLFENADKIIGLATSIVVGIADGIFKALPKLVAKLPTIVNTVWNGLKTIIVSLGNSVVDILNEVFGTNIPHISELRWPTWDEVKTGAQAAWQYIQAELQKLFVYVFGADEDGGVKWPTTNEIWAKMQEKAQAFWNWLKGKLHDLFVYEFGEDEEGGINWPQAEAIWGKVQQKAQAFWNWLKGKLHTVFVYAFGESEDGNITFPTAEQLWTKISGGFTTLWNGLKSKLSDAARFVFGEDEDGNITWPDASVLWLKVQTSFSDMWNSLKASLSHAARFIFGEDEDGNITWPSASALWNKVQSGFSTLWDNLKSSLSGVARLVFGEDEDGNITWPSASDLWLKIQDGLAAMWSGIKDSAKTVIKFLFGDSDDGGFTWPTASEVWTKISNAVSNLWSGIKNSAKNIFTFVFGSDENGGFTLESAANIWRKITVRVRNLWYDIKDRAKSAFTFTFGNDEQGGFIVPSAGTVWNKIRERLTTMWAGIREKADGMFEITSDFLTNVGLTLGLVDAQGQLQFPQSVVEFFNFVKDGLRQVLEFFGFVDKDGNWLFPDWLRQLLGLSNIFLKSLLKVLGISLNTIGDLNSEDAFSSIEGGITNIVGFLKDILDALGFVGEDGNFQLPETLMQLPELVADFIGTLAEGLGFIVDDGNGGKKFEAPQWMKDLIRDVSQIVESILKITGFMDAEGNLKVPEWVKTAIDAVTWTLTKLILPTVNAISGFVARIAGQEPEYRGSYTDSQGNRVDLYSVEGDFNEQNGEFVREHRDTGNPLIPSVGPPVFWPGGMPDSGPLAKGLDYVPYDGFIAELHRGEAVLNQDQGRKWRNGQGNGIDAQRLYDAVASAVAAAVENININMDGKLVGGAVSQYVSRNIYQNMVGRRVGAV